MDPRTTSIRRLLAAALAALWLTVGIAVVLHDHSHAAHDSSESCVLCAVANSPTVGPNGHFAPDLVFEVVDAPAISYTAAVAAPEYGCPSARAPPFLS